MNIQPCNQQVDKIFECYTRPGSPGAAVAVIKDGEILYRQGYGLADLEQGVTITPSTVFNLGSMAKQFTAFAVALLEAEKKLSFDDDIRTHLPEMPNLGHTITVRHLIHHVSGIRGNYPELQLLAEWRDGDLTTTEDVFNLLKAQRELNFRPGEEHLYVNSNYVLLALICQRVSGQSLADFCQQRIFDPLGMNNTHVYDSVFKLIPGRARHYYQDGEMWLNIPLTDSVLGPTNIYSTVEDLAQWDENFYTGRVGGMAVIEQMHQVGRLDNGTQLDYAFGLETGPSHRHRGWQLVEHGGQHGGYCAWMLRFPELHLSVAVLFNHFMWETRDYAIKVVDLFLNDKTEAQATEPTAPPASPQAVELSEAQLQAKAGSYFDPGRAALRQITVADGQLHYNGHALVPLSENRFHFQMEPQTQVEFRPDSVKTITPSGEYRYGRVETILPDDLSEYTGRYYSPELDIYWALEVRDSQLVIHRRKHVDTTLNPVFTDAFRDDWQPIVGWPLTFMLVFERDEYGVVNALRVSGDRVRRLKFERLA